MYFKRVNFMVFKFHLKRTHTHTEVLLMEGTVVLIHSAFRYWAEIRDHSQKITKYARKKSTHGQKSANWISKDFKN